MTETTTIETYAVGICSASACAPAGTPREDVEQAVTEQHPTGLDHGWEVADEAFKDGQPNPCPCNTNTEREHWLLHC